MYVGAETLSLCAVLRVYLGTMFGFSLETILFFCQCISFIPLGWYTCVSSAVGLYIFIMFMNVFSDLPQEKENNIN